MNSRIGSKRLDLTDLIEATRDPNDTWCELAVVRARNGQSHYEIIHSDGKDIDIFIEIEIVPTGEQMTVRLGLGNQAVWRIPEPDTEVIVFFPGGKFSGLAYIAAVTDKLINGGIPSTLDADTYVINNPKKIVITSQNDDVEVEALQGNVHITASNGQVYLNGQDQKIALADLVKSQLSSISTVFNAHTHSFVGTGTVGAPDGYSYTAGDVGSSKVKAGQ